MSQGADPRRLSRRALALAGLATAACSPAGLLNALVPASGYTLAPDLAYGPGPRHRLDLYIPVGVVSPPVVVFIYGGNWRSGDKGVYRFIGQALASRGVAVAIPDYRLFPEVRFPAFLEDNAAAVAWVADQARSRGLDSARLLLMGHSAGAYNAAMLTLDPQWLAAHGLSADQSLAGFAGLAGPYDFYPFAAAETRAVFADAADPRLTQPITFAGAGKAPLFLASGLDDDTVMPRNSIALAERRRAAGGRAVLRLYPGLGHVELIAALAAPLAPFEPPVRDDVMAYLTGSGAAPQVPSPTPPSRPD